MCDVNINVCQSKKNQQDKRQINEFAVKYLTLFGDAKTEENEVLVTFPDECAALGFEMDNGTSFIEQYSVDAFGHAKDLLSALEGIEDVNILGSAVYSKWNMIVHDSNANLLDIKNRAWFVLVFLRLKQLTQ